MLGIRSFGLYVPLWRLPLNSISPGLKGEKAMAGPDEDRIFADFRMNKRVINLL